MSISIKNKLCKLTKLSDDKFNGEHPNGIDKGYETYGSIADDGIKTLNDFHLLIGDALWLRTGIHKLNTKFFHTSAIKSIENIDNENNIIIFKTRNSTYKLEVFDKDFLDI